MSAAAEQNGSGAGTGVVDLAALRAALRCGRSLPVRHLADSAEAFVQRYHQRDVMVLCCAEDPGWWPMSTSQQSTEVPTAAGDAVADSAGCVQLQAGSVHLVMADTALDECHQGGAYFTLCGTVLPAAELPPWECPQGCTCDVDQMICQDCVRRAAERSAR